MFQARGTMLEGAYGISHNLTWPVNDSNIESWWQSWKGYSHTMLALDWFQSQAKGTILEGAYGISHNLTWPLNGSNAESWWQTLTRYSTDHRMMALDCFQSQAKGTILEGSYGISHLHLAREWLERRELLTILEKVFYWSPNVGPWLVPELSQGKYIIQTSNLKYL